MLESISDLFLKTTKKEFRVLHAIENKMNFYEWVPNEEIANFTRYDLKEVEFILSSLAKKKLVHRNIQAYEGYRIYFEAYDLLALNTFVKRGSINAIRGAGKEARFYEATGGIANRHVVIKFHRLSDLCVSRLAAKREHDALITLYPEVSVPEPLDYNRHAIVMSPVKGQQLAHARLDEPDWYLDEILNHVKKAYKLGIIHGDLSEFNIFVYPAGCEITDWQRYLYTAQAKAEELLHRDIGNVLSFFKRKYRIQKNIYEVADNIICQKK